MAGDITCEENQLGKRRILWHHKDICYLLTKDEGSGANKGISLDLSKTRSENTIKIHLPRGLTLLPTELRLLHWEGYPLNSLPSNSFLENLVELRMPHSQLKELWNAQLVLWNLKLIDLSNCYKLSQLPDFSTTPNVEILLLDGCKNLESLPQNMGNLEFLQTLQLNHTEVEDLPESICSLKHLKQLYILGCKRIHSLPDNFGNLVSLEVFCSTGTRISHVRSSFSQLQKLSCLYFCGRGNFIFPLSSAVGRLSFINLQGRRMKEFPISLCYLTSLEQLYIGGNDFESIPEDIEQLSNLVYLNIGDNHRLEYLPELPSQNLCYLCVNDCTSLKSSFSSFQLLQKQQKLIQLGFGNCINLDQEEYNQIIDHVVAMAEKDELQRKPMLCIPGSQVVRKIKYQNKRGSSLSLSFSSKPLEDLDFYFCAVFDPKFCPEILWPNICCAVIFTDESGQRYFAMTYCNDDRRKHLRSLTCVFYSAHVFLWREKLKFLQSEEGIGEPFITVFKKFGDLKQNEDGFADRCTIRFNFFRHHPTFWKDKLSVDDDAIIACGVYPIFEYPLLILEEDEDQEEEEEEEDVDDDPNKTITKNRKRKRNLHLKIETQ